MRTYQSITIIALLSISHIATGNDITILASKHSSRSNQIVPVDDEYGGLVVCHGNNGMQQWKTKLQKAGSYFIHVNYAAQRSRPVDLKINDKLQEGKYLGRTTGGWSSDKLTWETIGPFELKKGDNSIQINASGHMPHLAGLVISDNRTKWDRNTIGKLFDAAKKAGYEKVSVAKDILAANRQILRKKLGADELIFIKRYTYSSNHYYTEFINSKWTPGGGIFILALNDGSQRQIAAELTGGVFGRMDLSFDARKVVFDWKKSNNDGYRIYEVGVDGNGLRQVLKAPDDEAEVQKKYRNKYHHGSDDMHPCYLPDGGFAFGLDAMQDKHAL